MNVFKAINNGYRLAMQRVASSTSIRDSFEIAFGKFIELFYNVPFKLIAEKINKKSLNKALPLLAELCNLYTDLSDVVWLISAKLRGVAILSSMLPFQYIAITPRNFPCMYNIL